MEQMKREELREICVSRGYIVPYKEKKIELCKMLGIKYHCRSGFKEFSLVDGDGNVYRYNSVNEASRLLGKSTRTVNYLVDGESKRGWTMYNGKNLSLAESPVIKNGHRKIPVPSQ